MLSIDMRHEEAHLRAEEGGKGARDIWPGMQL